MSTTNSPSQRLVCVRARWRHFLVAFSRLTLLAQSILHTRKDPNGWIIPGAHRLKHPTRHPEEAKVITADGHPVDVVANDPDARSDRMGSAYKGQYSGVRVFEPLVLYHYVERGTRLLHSPLKLVD